MNGEIYGDKSVTEIREGLGIEPVEGSFSEGDVYYGPGWPKNPFDWRFRCSWEPVEVDSDE